MISNPKAAVVIVPALVALLVWLVVYWAALGPANL
jgi:hypothetical protein